MTLPGFTAENSIGPTIQTYRVQDRYGTAAAALHPQADEAMPDDGADEGFADDGADGMTAEDGDDAGAEDDAGDGEEPEGEDDLDEAEEA
jgi:hypothetical protein